MTFWSCQVGCNFSIGMPSCVAILSLYSQCLLGLALDSIGWKRMNENQVFRCLWSHRCPLVTEINMAEYGSCCKRREVLVDKSYRSSTEKLIDRLHNPPYLFLSREDDNEVRDIGKKKKRIFVRYYFTLSYLMLTPCFLTNLLTGLLTNWPTYWLASWMTALLILYSTLNSHVNSCHGYKIVCLFLLIP